MDTVQASKNLLMAIFCIQVFWKVDRRLRDIEADVSSVQHHSFFRNGNLSIVFTSFNQLQTVPIRLEKNNMFKLFT